eukprot:PhM_4_TR17385/c1_g1_i3/m.32856
MSVSPTIFKTAVISPTSRPSLLSGDGSPSPSASTTSPFSSNHSSQKSHSSQPQRPSTVISHFNSNSNSPYSSSSSSSSSTYPKYICHNNNNNNNNSNNISQSHHYFFHENPRRHVLPVVAARGTRRCGGGKNNNNNNKSNNSFTTTSSSSSSPYNPYNIWSVCDIGDAAHLAELLQSSSSSVLLLSEPSWSYIDNVRRGINATTLKTGPSTPNKEEEVVSAATPLQFAVAGGHRKCVVMILEHMSNNNNNKTPNKNKNALLPSPRSMARALQYDNIAACFPASQAAAACGSSPTLSSSPTVSSCCSPDNDHRDNLFTEETDCRAAIAALEAASFTIISDAVESSFVDIFIDYGGDGAAIGCSQLTRATHQMSVLRSTPFAQFRAAVETFFQRRVALSIEVHGNIPSPAPHLGPAQNELSDTRRLARKTSVATLSLLVHYKGKELRRLMRETHAVELNAKNFPDWIIGNNNNSRWCKAVPIATSAQPGRRRPASARPAALRVHEMIMSSSTSSMCSGGGGGGDLSTSIASMRKYVKQLEASATLTATTTTLTLSRKELEQSIIERQYTPHHQRRRQKRIDDDALLDDTVRTRTRYYGHLPKGLERSDAEEESVWRLSDEAVANRLANLAAKEEELEARRVEAHIPVIALSDDELDESISRMTTATVKKHAEKRSKIELEMYAREPLETRQVIPPSKLSAYHARHFFTPLERKEKKLQAIASVHKAPAVTISSKRFASVNDQKVHIERMSKK